jgi:hypothetical protein
MGDAQPGGQVLCSHRAAGFRYRCLLRASSLQPPLQLMSNLDFKAAIEELKAAAQYLRAQGAKKVGGGHQQR